MKIICPFCGRIEDGSLPKDCSRCEAADGPGTGTPMQEYRGKKMKNYEEIDTCSS